MWMIAGLGNPERKYMGTRHNAGFRVLDSLLMRLGDLKLPKTKFRGAYTMANYGAEKLLLLKPLTYMNCSGDCIAPLAAYYRIPAERVLVIVDDIALPIGQLRLRPRGSAGGHNGLKSVIQRLSTEDFPRVRVGVGAKPVRMDLAAYVLSGYDPEDREAMEEAYKEAAQACLDIVDLGMEKAMNLHNARVQPKTADAQSKTNES